MTTAPSATALERRADPPLNQGDADAPAAPVGPDALRQQLVANLGTIHALLDQFAAEAQLPPGLHLTPVEVCQLEGLLGVSVPLTAGPQLLAQVERLTAMKIGDIRIPFTPGQLSELQHRASKRGRTVEAEMQAVVDRIRDELFYRGG